MTYVFLEPILFLEIFLQTIVFLWPSYYEY